MEEEKTCGYERCVCGWLWGMSVIKGKEEWRLRRDRRTKDIDGMRIKNRT